MTDAEMLRDLAMNSPRAMDIQRTESINKITENLLTICDNLVAINRRLDRLELLLQSKINPLS